MGKKVKIKSINKSNKYDKKEEETFDESAKFDEETIEWVEKNTEEEALTHFHKNEQNFEGNILELGAGYCWTGGILSKFKDVKKVSEVDISKQKLKKGRKVLEYVDAKKEKITMYHGDFLNLNHFPQKSFDFVVLDATFHHTYRPIRLLKEIRNLLKNEGVLFMQREPMIYPKLSVTRWKNGLNITGSKNMVRRERQKGHDEQTELTYSYDEYLLLSHLGGFSPRIVPFTPKNCKAEYVRKKMSGLLSDTSNFIKKMYSFFNPSWYFVLRPSDHHREY